MENFQSKGQNPEEIYWTPTIPTDAPGQALEQSCLCLNPSSLSYQPCDSGRVPDPSWASVSSLGKGGDREGISSACSAVAQDLP